MAGKILVVHDEPDRCRKPQQDPWGKDCATGGGRVADILFGDFDRVRTEATVGSLRRNLLANEIHVVRSGCEALEFLRRRGSTGDGERCPRPALVILDEDLSGMAGHSILRAMRKVPFIGEMPVIILVGRDRVAVHRQWTPEADGYLEKPFSFRKFVASLRSLRFSWAVVRIPFDRAPMWQGR